MCVTMRYGLQLSCKCDIGNDKLASLICLLDKETSLFNSKRGQGPILYSSESADQSLVKNLGDWDELTKI